MADAARPAPESSSLLPPALRWSGPLLALGYGLGARVHRAISSPQYAPLPTICIGNITVGGTGKTPAAKYFARKLLEQGHKPAVLMRGYKEQASDEACEIENAFPEKQVPVLIGGDRLASARAAKAQGCDVVMLDDGFQHWRLARDLDIVLVDAINPFGGDHLAPWGRLRESPEALSRAGVVIITRADAVSDSELALTERKVSQLMQKQLVARASHKPVRLRSLDGKQSFPLEELRNQAVTVLCGIGNPAGFCRTLESLGARIGRVEAKPDHYGYHDEIIFDLIHDTAGLIVTTQKDAVKLAGRVDDEKIRVLEIEFSFISGEAEVLKSVDAAIERGRARLNGAS